MRGRRTRAATLERDIAEARSRAAESISELAEHAVTIAREAGQAARPTVQHGAEGLSHALERAASTLADTAEHLASAKDGKVGAAGNAARERIADASERLSTAIRPKKKTHRVRNLLIGAAVIGGIIALVQSPLRSKIQERLFGPPPEDDLPQITLPDDNHQVTAEPTSPEPDAAADVVGTAAVAEQSAPRGRGRSNDETVENQETNA